MDRLVLDVPSAVDLSMSASDAGLLRGRTCMPSLEQVLAEAEPLPTYALFLGQAEDGLPILLNLYDATRGPILVMAGEYAGKTLFLRSIARAAIHRHAPGRLQLGVITNRVHEWQDVLVRSSHCVGVFASDSLVAKQLVQTLKLWLERPRVAEQSVLLLIDNFEDLLRWDECSLNDLREVLSHGPQGQVWPIVTVDRKRCPEMSAWLPVFHTQILQEGSRLSLGDGIRQSVHENPNHIGEPWFAFRKQDTWIRFWVPS